MGLFVLSLSNFAFATATPLVSLQMKLELHGQSSEPLILTHLGSPATILQQDEETGKAFEILVNPKSLAVREGVKTFTIEMEISEILNGQRKILSKPRVTSLEGKTFKIEQGFEDRIAFVLEGTPTLMK